MHFTRFAGLTELDPGDPITIDGASFLQRNPSETDHYLRIGAVTHRHDGHAQLPDPTSAPSASIDTFTVGQIPANVQIYAAYTLIDGDGGETKRSIAATVSTPAGAPSPSAGISAVFDSTGGSLPVGQFAYALTLNDGTGGETTLGPAAFVTRSPGFPSGQVQLSGLAQELGNIYVSWNLWRAQDGQPFQIIQAAQTGSTFTDTGLICTDAARQPPNDMSGVLSTNTLDVTLPTAVQDPPIGSAVSISLYLSLDGTFGNPCFYATYPVASAGNTIVIPALSLSQGSPPRVSRASQGANQINPDTDILDWHWKRPVATSGALPSGAQGDVRLVIDTGHPWAVLGASAPGGSSTGWTDILSLVADFDPGATIVASAGSSSASVSELEFVGANGITVSMTSSGGSAIVTVSASGSLGPAGPAGASGAVGAPGAPGASGAAGASGPQGPAGSAANFVASAGTASAIVGPALEFVGSGATQVQLSRVGGSAIVTITTPTVAGPAGAQGPAGASGAQGPAGASGAQGATGPQGIQGPAGTGGGGSIAVTGSAGITPVNPASDIEFTGSGGTNVAVQNLGGGSARVVISASGLIGPAGPQGPAGTSGGGGSIAVTGSAGITPVNPASDVEFAGSGGVGVTVQSLGGGSARVLIGLSQLIPVAKSANYTAVNNDFVEMSGGNTVTLPSPVAGRIVGAQSVNGAGSAACTVSTPTGAIIGKGVVAGATSILLGTPGASVVLLADGTNWNIISGEQDSGWITPASFTNSWVNGSPPMQYRLTANIVRFIGQMSSGTAAQAAFTLPSGYRPTVNSLYLAIRYNAGSQLAAIVQINSTGVVIPQVTDSTAFYLTATSFPLD